MFYERFLASYDQLLTEIIRRLNLRLLLSSLLSPHSSRREILRKEQKVVDGFQQELDRLWKDEATRREAFQYKWGDYLPPSLFPPLMVIPSHNCIHLDLGRRSSKNVASTQLHPTRAC